MSLQKKQKILVAMTGRIDSTIAAYLLKKQGHDVIGIGIVFGRSPSEQEENKSKAEFVGVYQLNDVDSVKKICQQIDIPFYAVDATKKYQARITDQLVGARVGGLLFSPKVHCNKLIFETLIEKMEKLGADAIASGHYSKVIKNLNNGDYNVYVANDVEQDQSYLLSQLNQEQLSKVIFPLAEMRKKEVEKVREMISVKVLPPYNGIKDIMKHPKMVAFVNENISQKLVKEGPIIEYKNDSVMGDHNGIHHFFLGESDLKTKQGTMLDKSLIVSKINYTGGVVYLSYRDDLSYRYVILKNIAYNGVFDLTKPIEVYYQKEEFGKKEKAICYLKNNNTAMLELSEASDGLLFHGQFITLFNRSGLGGKVIGGGEVQNSGLLKDGVLRSLPEKSDDKEDEDGAEQVDIYEFKF
tara:strand:+ start:390792 stop:392024 length:1233 start_codon:yes stop_codon:yes gene_type:complete